MNKHTMNVSLTPELDGIVQRYIQSGMYGSQSEVVRAALRLLHEQEQEREARLLSLRNDVQSGLRQVLTGEGLVITAETIKTRGRRRMNDLG